MSGAIARNSGILDGEATDRIIRSRDTRYLLATRRAVVSKTRVVSCSDLTDTSTWEAQRWFPENELWLSFRGEYLVLRRDGRSVKQLYKGSEQSKALEAYNTVEG